MLAKKIKTVVTIFNDKGLLSVINTAFKKIFPSGNWLLSWDRRLLLKCQFQKNDSAQDKGDPQTSDHPHEYQVQRLNEQDALSLVGVNSMTKQAIEAALSRKEHCWCIYQQKIFMGYVWITDKKTNIVSDTGYLFPLNNESVYWWRDAYIMPEYRGQRIVLHLFKGWKKTINASLNDTIYTETDPQNIASIISHNRLGFEEIARLVTFCILGFRFYFLASDYFPKYCFRFYPNNTFYHHDP